MMSVNRRRGQESDAEIAFITDLAAEWAYEKNGVKDLLKEPASSGLEGYRAGAIRTTRLGAASNRARACFVGFYSRGNPAVTLSDAIEGGISWPETPAFILAQVCGAILETISAHLMFQLPLLSLSPVTSGAGRLRYSVNSSLLLDSCPSFANVPTCDRAR
jgi:hypothetical protein